MNHRRPYKMDRGNSNWFLQAVLNAYRPSARGVYSVLSSDELKLQPRKKNYGYVVNLSERGEPGTHFILLLRQNTCKKLYYLDPLADYAVHNSHIYDFLEKETNASRGLKIIILRRPVQAPRSTKCGLFCLYFLYSKSKKFKDKSKITPLTYSTNPAQLKNNDGIVMKNLFAILTSFKT